MRRSSSICAKSVGRRLYKFCQGIDGPYIRYRWGGSGSWSEVKQVGGGQQTKKEAGNDGGAASQSEFIFGDSTTDWAGSEALRIEQAPGGTRKRSEVSAETSSM